MTPGKDDFDDDVDDSEDESDHKTTMLLLFKTILY